jgi:acetyl-CoA/propionyl-CoA carboxylase biotin carboxyl carrier protein
MASIVKKLLIANRGEIALRVVRTAKEMGISTVAVYSEQDRNSRYVDMADEAYLLSGDTYKDTYLNEDLLIDILHKTGADAVHPGYGFLSEVPSFAQKVEDAGAIWVGPHHTALVDLGDKITARRVALRAKVPPVPGLSEPVTDVRTLLDFAHTHGYPIMMKRTDGGGGHGITVVHDDEELRRFYMNHDALQGGDLKEYFIEKFVDKARHVETQSGRDSHGNFTVYSTRDCSLQRRNQKVIEESPAIGIPRRAIEKIGERCAEGCRKIGYRGAGTFEFLYENGEFYFIEMNTRIQVEHPVTEFVTGVDLVQEQIRIAAGEKLRYRQRDIQIKGHAIECRINAEDPYRFIPSPGRITTLHQPGGPGVRVDSHVYPGYFIPPHYDSMIGKLITYGDTRDQAIARMRTALSETVIEGISTNIPLHREMMIDQKFLQGGVSIHYLEEKLAHRESVKK